MILLVKIALPCLVRWISSLSSRMWFASRVSWSYNSKPCHQHRFCQQVLTCPISPLTARIEKTSLWPPRPWFLLFICYCSPASSYFATQSKSQYESSLLNALGWSKLNSVNVTCELCVSIKELLAHTSLVSAYQILQTQERKNSRLYVKFWCNARE